MVQHKKGVGFFFTSSSNVFWSTEFSTVIEHCCTSSFCSPILKSRLRHGLIHLLLYLFQRHFSYIEDDNVITNAIVFYQLRNTYKISTHVDKHQFLRNVEKDLSLGILLRYELNSVTGNTKFRNLVN